jgi:multicomponent Na+:H+ antiporter subunit D
MKAAMGLFAFLCIGLGVYPDPLYAILPYPVDYVPYTVAHVVNMLQLLLFAGLAFFVMLPLMQRTLTISLDVDWFYRVLGSTIARAAGRAIARALDGVYGAADVVRARLTAWVFKHHGPTGLLAKTYPAGSMALGVVVLLGVYLVVYFVKGG